MKYVGYIGDGSTNLVINPESLQFHWFHQKNITNLCPKKVLGFDLGAAVIFMEFETIYLNKLP